MKKYIIFVVLIFVILLFIGAPVRHIYAPFKYRSLVKAYAAKYDLDWLLVASIIYHESRFRRDAVSPRGARGLMQVMPDTAREIASKLGWDEVSSDDLFNPRINLELGCWYFNDIMKEFNNEPKVALAAYNAGRGNVYRWGSQEQGSLAYPSSNKPEYDNIDEHIYPETEQYVYRVVGTYKLLKTLNKVWRL